MKTPYRLMTALLLTLLPALATRADAADTRLADAAMERNATAVRALLAEKVDVNAPGVDGTPALHWAVRVDDLDMASVRGHIADLNRAGKARTSVARKLKLGDAWPPPG